jgi:Helix-turn-helix domain
MPAPLDPHIRRRIFARWQQGRTPADIAFELHLAPRTVRQLCQRFRELGKISLDPSYYRRPPAPPTRTIQKALLLREQHPTWGAAYILLNLRQRHPELEDLPSERTLQRRFREARQPPAPPGRKPPANRALAARPHEVWQMDAVEQCPLQTGENISWLRWVDEYSGAVLGTVVFPRRDVWPSAGHGGGQRFAPVFSALGPADAIAGRQWHAVGQLE